MYRQIKNLASDFYSLFKSGYDSLLNSGINRQTLISERKYIVRYNQFFFSCILLYLLSIIVNIFNGLYLSAFVIVVSLSLSIVNYAWVYSQKNRKVGKYILLIIVNLTIVFLSYVEGLFSGNYIYLFPLIVSQTFVLDYKEKNDVKFSFILSGLSIAAIFFISPAVSPLQFLAVENHRALFYSNTGVALFISLLFAYLVIRENKKYEDELDRERFYLDTVFNTSPDAVFIAESPSGKVIDCNDQSVEIFKLKNKKEAINKSVFDFLITQYDTNEPAVNLFTNFLNVWRGEIHCVTAKQDKFLGFVSVASFTNSGKLYRKISINDITEYKKAQVALVESKEKAEQAAAAKSFFLSNMSHELRTPLNGIIGTTNLLLQDNYLESQREHLGVLKYSSEHILALINDILDFSKIDAGKTELEKNIFNLKNFIEKIDAVFRNQFALKKVSLNINIDERLDRKVVGDSTRLHQVITNLLSNACKFTHEGMVTLTARFISGTSDAIAVEFSVADTGIGIAKKKLDTIFEDFYQANTQTTRKYGGTGLGLAISKKLVDLFSSELKVKSEFNKGSEFSFIINLPVHIDIKDAVATPVNHRLESFQGIKILIAEDNPINMMIARKFLQKWDVETKEAQNGLEAVELFKLNYFDLLLLDLEMPEMDGYTALEEVRKINSSIPIIAFTAASFDDMSAKLKLKGFNDYVQKPFRPDDLHKKILRNITAGPAAA
jgi:signal transduction histidine kinase/ActR/RegA family two-component response regulator